MVPTNLLLLLTLSLQDAPAFERIRLSDEFLSEGGSTADLDRDGHGDVIVGPWWYAGPDFAERHALYAPRHFDPKGYSDNFFCWPRDFDLDGWIDLLFVGFPGQAAKLYRNPGAEGDRWRASTVFETVDNESPAFVDLTGDGNPELVCIHGGRYGYAGPDPSDPWKPWAFHAITPDLGLQRFTHGLGVGDVDGDGRADVLEKTGWWQQPPSLAGDPVWRKHEFVFTPHGGAQMFAYDVDGDGDGDVVTSLWAHGFGLAWFEQVRSAAEEISFVRHMLLGETLGERIGGVQFAELHALDLADVNGDGLLDVVTGKRWWSHGAEGDPELGNPSVVYWFELVRTESGATFVPHLIDDDSGVGTQVVARDVDGDGRVDVVVGNKKGAFVLLQRPRGEPALQRVVAPVTATLWVEEEVGERPVDEQGRALNLDLETGDLTDWLAEGGAFDGQPVAGDATSARGREPSLHQGRHWIGGYEAIGDGPTGTLRSVAFRATHPWASFLVGGGGHAKTCVETRREDDDRLVFRSSGPNFESMQRVAVDLRSHLGERIYLRLVDGELGGWGHVNYDDFRFHAESPSFVRPSGVPEIRQPDPVENEGLAPAEAVAAMTVPEGFRVDLIAAEPDLHQPIALAVDARNRLWVAEAFSYPVRRADDEARDALVVFEDADGDGSYETRTVFADDLNLVSGFEVGHGGVFVGAAPYLLFLPDRDDDLVPDGPAEVLLDGWGYEDTHETLNAFTWGPDGWLYGCHGVFTHSRVGAPGTPDDERVPLNAGVWRYHPTRRAFEVFAWGTSNPWGVTFDEHGQAFVTACVIPHLFHLTQGGRYERQAGRHFGEGVYADIATIADHRHWIGETPHSGNNRSSAAGGGHAHCGALIYLGDSFPASYRGTIFMNNVHGNRVNNDRLERRGSGFVGTHADDFLLANDRWFRGISLKTGPDGSVYLIDWYDPQACHLQQPEVWDRTNGRLYRVSYGAYRPFATDLRALPSRELVGLLLHRNDWFVTRARLVLQERGPDAATQELLRRLLATERAQRETLSLLWGLHVAGGLTDADLLATLASRHEYVRAWSVQLACETGDPAPAVLTAMGGLARSDESPVVRLYLAAALQRLSSGRRGEIAGALAALHPEDAEDANLPLLLWYGIEPMVAADPRTALSIAEHAASEQLREFVFRRMAADRSGLEQLVRTIEHDGRFREPALAAMSAALAGELAVPMPAAWPSLYRQLERAPIDGLREEVLWLAVTFGDSAAFPELRRLAADAGAERTRRERAIDALVRGRDGGAVGVLQGLLDEPALRGAALRALASFDDPAIGPALLARYAGFDVEARRDAVNTLGARPRWARELLTAVREGRVPRADVGAFVLRKMESHHDPGLDAMLTELWPVRRPTAAEAVERIAELKSELTSDALAAADLAHGRELFARTCSQCHTLFDAGGDLAPELTGSNRGDLEYLLSNMVDPNAVIGKDYQVTVAWLLDGRIETGIEVARSDTAVTLRSENDTVVVALDEVDVLQLSELSTMPEGLLDALGTQEVIDLVAYLQADAQVARRTGALFDGESLAGWTGDPSVWSVEDGEIVGRSESGLARNEFLRSDLELADFRLSLEVRLVGNAGNSGIQFRSTALEEGEVAGYQADVGAGWWGKLYEEHGRAVLWDRSGDEHVREDAWNAYVIEAIGPRLRTWINGRPCVDLDDPEGARAGIVALQVHSGGPTEVRFRNFELELDPTPRDTE